MPRDHFGARLDVLLQDGGAQLVKAKAFKDPLAVEVENPQVFGFVQIAFDHLEMRAIALLGERERHLERNELTNLRLSSSSSFGAFRDVCEVRTNSAPLAVSSKSDFIEKLLRSWIQRLPVRTMATHRCSEPALSNQAMK